MCNNLLQYAHVYAWGREHGRKVMSMRFSYKYRFFKISHSEYVSFPLYVIVKYLAALKLFPKASFKKSDCDKGALERKMLRHSNIVVSGWFVRFYDLFMKYIDEIRDLFTLDREYTEPVRIKMQNCEQKDSDIVRIGVHIRRGDYKEWRDGRYYYSDEQYAACIIKMASLFPGKSVHVYVSTNDFGLTEVRMQQMTQESGAKVHLLGNDAPGDLFMLSECDYIIGPPSTFSVVASMYRDVPFYRMDTTDADRISLEAFHDFNYWFRRINEL